MFSAKGAGLCKPGATPQGKVCPRASAESANQIIAKEDAEVNRAFSAGEFLTKTSINIAPLALNKYLAEARCWPRVTTIEFIVP